MESDCENGPLICPKIVGLKKFNLNFHRGTADELRQLTQGSPGTKGLDVPDLWDDRRQLSGHAVTPVRPRDTLCTGVIMHKDDR